MEESLRIRPPVTDEIPKRVPDGGETVTVEGAPVWLPGGTYVGVATLALLRWGIFGGDVDQLRPERWLIDDEQRLASMNRTLELIFGYGKYQCLGKIIAWIEMRKTLFEASLRTPSVLLWDGFG